MSDYRKSRLRGWQRELEEINKEISKVRASTEEELQKACAAELSKRRYLEENIGLLETQILKEQAQSFGINLFPPDADPLVILTSWSTTIGGSRFLKEEARASLNNRIIDARFAYWKRWVDIVAPVGSLIISIIALIVAIIAIVK